MCPNTLGRSVSEMTVATPASRLQHDQQRPLAFRRTLADRATRHRAAAVPAADRCGLSDMRFATFAADVERFQENASQFG